MKGGESMDAHERQKRHWPIVYWLVHHWVSPKFALEHDVIELHGGALIICNHVTNCDPMMLAMCFPDTPLYFVASEHIFRRGLLSRLLHWLVQPISRSKGAMASDTVKACLRHLKAGHAVVLFAEGDASWDGRAGKVFPATGKLARLSGTELVTCRLIGGYLSLPRWGRGVRRGGVRAKLVNRYSPETLKAMTPEAITASIDRDIGEDAWQRQREERRHYPGRRPAEGLEQAVYLCPRCKEIGTLRSEGNRISCFCGFSLRYRDTGFFDPPEPFATIADWEDWQRSELDKLEAGAEGLLFSDGGIRLSLLESGHRERRLEIGELRQYEDRLELGQTVLPLDAISSMAIVKTRILLLTCGERYYELRADRAVNFRKYLAFYQSRR